MELPPPLHEKSHWVSQKICIGAKPLKNFHWLLESPNYDVTKWLVVSLVESDFYLPPHVERIKYVIDSDGNSKSKDPTPFDDFIESLEDFLSRDYTLYIHSQDGIGRSNMVAGILVGRANGWEFRQTNKWLVECRKTRPYKGRDFVPTFEYHQQYLLVQEYVGGTPTMLLGDEEWTKELVTLRKMETQVDSYPEAKFFGKGNYKEFSNFYDSPIKSKGKIYPTVEHFFQAKKFDYPGASEDSKEYAELIRKAKTPGMAKMLANQKPSYRFPWMRDLSDTIKKYPHVKLRADWEEVKEKVMMVGLYNKFLDCSLMKKLLDTGYDVIIEDSPYDSYWGIGKNGDGKNRLGVCLMYLRSILREK